ncbi:hypothetical protein ACIHDR_38780 [Nocardia sp. NPDC052278]|uniref:hypothetical protein n=1 Tax=unclassified Nocardia TaxID=2637762 RepID=UPI0036771CA6
MASPRSDTMVSLEPNAVSADYVRARIREIVSDRETAELLCPNDHPIGAKRTRGDTDYYATYNRPSVDPVDVCADPIHRFTPHGLRAGEQEYELDAVVLATGDDAMTSPLNGSISGTRREIRCARTGRPVPGPTSASPSRASRTCSPSPDLAVRRS